MSEVTRRLSFNPYIRDYGNNLTDDFGTIEPLTSEQIHAARMQVALHGGGEIPELLSMLGIGRDVTVHWEAS